MCKLTVGVGAYVEGIVQCSGMQWQKKVGVRLVMWSLENLALDSCGGMPENPQFGVWNVSHFAS